MRCDQDANVYLVQAPHYSAREAERAAKAGRDLDFDPRQVLRISAEGGRKKIIDPAAGTRFATAKRLLTAGIALDRDGTLYLLVWVTWDGEDPDARSQYILSLDERGKWHTEVDVDEEEMTVRRFAVFGSGDFLLVGHPWGKPDEERLAILEASGGKLRDVPGWSGYPAGVTDETSETGTVLFDYMVLGGDGRIYFAEQDPRLEEIVVFAFEPSGVSGEAFRLPRMPRNRQLRGLQAADDRIAAIYGEPSPDRKSARFWIAVFDSVLGGEMHTLYGPVPGRPLCCQRGGSEDRFTTLYRGKLVTMAP
jgi:hypothetical protein